MNSPRREVYMRDPFLPPEPAFPLKYDFTGSGYVHTCREHDGRFCVEALRGPLFYRIFVGNEDAARKVHAGMVRAMTRRAPWWFRFGMVCLAFVRGMEARCTRSVENAADRLIDLETLAALYPKREGWGRCLKIVLEPGFRFWSKP